MKEGFRILGIDPGTATTGYGIIDLVCADSYRYVGSGIIQTSKHLPPSTRLKIIREDVLSLIELYAPDVMSIEAVFFFKNAKTLVPVAQARGVVMEAAASRGLAVAEYTPMQIKMSVSGYGRAEKREVQFVVSKLLKHEQVIKPDDACDAVAAAICHARHRLGVPLPARNASISANSLLVPASGSLAVIPAATPTAALAATPANTSSSL